MNPFDTQWEQLAERLRATRYPGDDATLDRLISRVVADDRPAAPPKPVAVHRRSLRYIAAAACLLALLVPVGIAIARPDDAVRTVRYEGQTLRFACNDGCSVENTIQSFNNSFKVEK